MSGFTRQFSSASPVLAITPLPSHQNHLSGASFSHQRGHSSVSLHCPSLFTGRKRRRDEAGPNLDSDSPSPSAHNTPKDWTFGQGNVLFKPGMSFDSEGSTSSNSWLGQRDALQDARVKLQASVAAPRNHKSLRVDSTNHPEIRLSTPATAAIGVSGLCANNAAQPIVDNFTLQLGVGWRKISNEDHIQAAARGWARFIENHYPLSHVNILLESKGLQSYLVETSQGFYLFSEDLRRARLVSQNANGALENLQQSPPIFEGTEELWRVDSPRSSQNALHATSTDSAMTLD